MKIAYFTDTFLPQHDGVATSLAASAYGLVERGHSVVIVTPKFGQGPVDLPPKLNVLFVPSLPAVLYPGYRIGVGGLLFAWPFLQKFQPDIIHFHTTFSLGLDAVIMSKLLRKPLVGTIHNNLLNPDYWRWLEKIPAAWLVRVSSPVFRWFYDVCDLRLAPSHYMIADLGEKGFRKPIVYLTYAPVLSHFPHLTQPEKERVRKKFGLGKKAILFCGRISEEKRLDVLVGALARLTKSHPEVTLTIIGDGPARDKIKEQVRSLKLQDQVVFTGVIAHEDLPKSGLYQVSDVFVTPSPMENRSMAVLEAMAAGLPIVGVAKAGTLELVRNNGFLVPDGNAVVMAEKIALILDQEKLQQTMSRRSRLLARQFSAQEVAGILEKYYEQLIATKN